MKHEYLFQCVGLLAIHWVPLMLAAWKWPFRSSGGTSSVQFVLGIASWLVVLGCVFIFFDFRPRSFGGGHGAGWYLVYSLLTLGVLPAMTITCHVLAGRFLGRYL